MSVRVTAECTVRADAVAQFLEIAKKIVEKTNALDKGCISYQMYRNVEDPLCCTMIEEWEDRASLDAHLAAPHCDELLPQMNECCVENGVSVKIYEKAF